MKRFLRFGVAALATLMVGAVLLSTSACSSKEEEKEESRQPGTPSLKSDTEYLSLSSDEQLFRINLTLENPTPGAELTWRCNDAWIEAEEFELPTLQFRIAANPGKERSTVLRLIYPGAAILPIEITQAAQGEEVGPTIHVAKSSYSLSAAEEDLTINYTILNPVEGGALEIATPAPWVCIYAIDRADFSLLVEANEAEEERTTTLTLSYPGAKEVELRLIQAGQESPTPPAEPEFANLSANNITATSADLSCRFDYAGQESVTETGFCYRGPSGSEQEVRSTTSTGTKSTTLTGLTADTSYEWYFYAVIGDELYTSATQEFRTLSDSKPAEGKVYRTGWPELCVEDDTNSDYYYAHHITDLSMKGNKARNYTVCYSASHHCPVWVAAPRHSAYEGSTKRTDAYAKDPQIPSDIQYHSKDTGGGCNKGHMLGSAERTASTTTNKQVFYYTNIAPQYSSGFNTGGGGWNILEDWMDGQVCADTTYLVIGTYFERYTDGYGETASPKKISFGDRSDVSCPTMFYIAALRTKKGNTGKSVLNCSASELKCAAFVRTHTNNHKGQKVTSREMMSIADLEKLTGHKFFVNVPNAPKQSFSASEWGL